MSDVFISYKREDIARMEPLNALLLDLDVPVWFDAGIEVGAAWEKRIEDQIDQAKAVIVCWTFAAISSHWVKREAEIGYLRGMLAPVRLEPCTLVAPFDAVQTADLADWRGAPDHPEVQKLLLRLEQLLGRKHLARNARLRAGGQREEMVALLRGLLVERALTGAAPWTYTEAAIALREAGDAEGIQIGEFDQQTLWGALDAISEQNRRRREPPLDVLVVSKETGRPGRGYWQKSAFLAGDGDELEQRMFERHLARVRAAKWEQDV